MKEPVRAPAYAVLYHGLCDIARRFGYALAIHGTVTADLDLIAVPWVDNASPADELVRALVEHCDACLDGGDGRGTAPETKPHGRRAWNLYMGHGAKVDLSILPREPAYWQPTPENINLLPARIRGYIHDLETNCDPAGMVRENTIAKGTIAALQTRIAEMGTEAERLKAGLRFYAHRQHMVGLEDWEEGSDPDSPWWADNCMDRGEESVETGGCARLVLAGRDPDWDEEGPPPEHPCEAHMQAVNAAIGAEDRQ